MTTILRKISFLLLLLILYSGTYSGVKEHISIFFKYPFKVVPTILFNKHFQKYGSFVFYAYGQGICDAKSDGWVFDNLFGDELTFGVSDQSWHYYKNLSRIFTITSFALKGLEVGQKHTSFLNSLERFVYESFFVWFLWHKFYYKSRYNDYWNTSHSQRIIYYPDPFNNLNDAYIGMKGNQVYYFDIFRISIFIFGVIKLSF